ncbi:LysE family translocator [Vibrio fluvialis]|uniref:LysE family translocator n=1 Tax=Vibrio sp. bablab_jr001 TaxID=2755067 RepID=UPI0018F19361|nr:LysE family translocator [Vibrio sp. bablab_jr001]EKO3398678.1 LysE family translocator [Vibrio fluvialis]EKO3471927.1 LysE family translocator [Vibrio fluvialis]MBY8115442.1 LysE family translocator [Vibrio fluvialis]MBY8250577.1 LysE family translocator [Vibrio fluvialis]MBY8282203.1 LysE family translocator [Vibrio fluvialis]
MDTYFSFAAIALAVVYMPGPGTLKSITNAINFGFQGSVVGISGLTLGVCAVAVFSATSLGLLLVSSPMAFQAVSYCGSAYLFYLGFKLWFSSRKAQTISSNLVFKKRQVFGEGILLQFTNPNAILFFFSIFPHFIKPDESYVMQFSVLVGIFSLAFICAHSTYALLAYKAKNLFVGTHRHWLNKINAILFILLAIYLVFHSSI